jgi:hypothetical protein
MALAAFPRSQARFGSAITEGAVKRVLRAALLKEGDVVGQAIS